MTTYTALGGDWGLASDWVGGVVPTSADPDADVELSYWPLDLVVTVAASESYAVRSLALEVASLTIAGSLAVSQSVATDEDSTLAMAGGVLTASSIGLGTAGDQITGSGTVNGAIVDDGTILAGVYSAFDSDEGLFADDLVINGAVSGSGVIEIAGGISNPGEDIYFPVSGTLELNGASANAVVFENGVGALQLDQPSAFTGTLSVASVLATATLDTPSYASFSLTLEGVSFSSVTSYSYSGGASGGVLTFDTSAGNYAYNFAGPFEESDFALSGNSAVLVVTATPKPMILGTVGGQKITTAQTLHPFANVVISDFGAPQASGQAKITFHGGSGTWSNLGAGSVSGSSYLFDGAVASVTAALEALVFTPTPSSVTLGASETIAFTLTYADELEPTATDSTTSVVVTGTTLNIPQSGIPIYASNATVSFAAGANGDTIVGDDDTITSPAGETLTFSGAGDAVYLSSGTEYLEKSANVCTVGNDDLASAAGSGDIVGFIGVGDVAQISNGTIYLGGATNVVVEGNNDVANAGTPDDVMGFMGAGDVAELSNGTVYLGEYSNVVVVGENDVANAGTADDVLGFIGTGDVAEISNGTVYLGGASNVVVVGDNDVANAGSAGDVMGFFGTGDVAEISNGTIYLGNSTTVSVVGDNDVANTAATRDVMGFIGTGDVAEISNGTVNLGALSSVAIFGDNDFANAAQPEEAMTFTGSGDTAEISNGTLGLQSASVALVGANDTISLPALFGLDTLSGFGATDRLQFSHQDFASAAAVLAAATQSGSDTLITLDANDTLRLSGVNLASLTASQIAIV